MGTCGLHRLRLSIQLRGRLPQKISASRVIAQHSLQSSPLRSEVNVSCTCLRHNHGQNRPTRLSKLGTARAGRKLGGGLMIRLPQSFSSRVLIFIWGAPTQSCFRAKWILNLEWSADRYRLDTLGTCWSINPGSIISVQHPGWPTHRFTLLPRNFSRHQNVRSLGYFHYTI